MRGAAMCSAMLLALLPIACSTQSYPTLIPVQDRPEGRLISRVKKDYLILLVQSISVSKEEADMLEHLWRYVDESAFAGTSKEVWNEQGLRVGVATHDFLVEAQKVMDASLTKRTTSDCFQRPKWPGSSEGMAFRIRIDNPGTGRNLVIMHEEGPIEAERWKLEIDLSWRSIEQDKVPLTIMPIVIAHNGRTRNIELKDLRGKFRCRNFEPIVLGQFAQQAVTAGSAFVFTEKPSASHERLMVIFPVFFEQNAQ